MTFRFGQRPQRVQLLFPQPKGGVGGIIVQRHPNDPKRLLHFRDEPGVGRFLYADSRVTH